MKKWTCLFIAIVLVCACARPVSVSTIDVENTAVVVSDSVYQRFFKEIARFFLGIENKNVSVEIVKASDDKEQFEPSQSEEEKISFDNTSTEKPTVLIYHTHTDEGYFLGDHGYVETSTGRTLDENFSVVAVGETLKNELENMGFTVIHDKTDNSSKDFKNAYKHSLESIQKYIGKADLYIDLHRDAYYGQDRDVEYNNQKCAHVCCVVANGQNYSDKPKYSSNYALAKSITENINKICPNMANGVITKNARYNQHISDSCLLLEMGQEENDIEEVKRSASIVAQAINNYYA